MHAEGDGMAEGMTADDRAESRPTDRELIARLRTGDLTAYEALWSAHVGAALRVARRYDPHRAEDLVSEAFLAVYEQIAVVGNGPETAFRAYLFTVIRNAAAKHARLDDLVVSDPDIDPVDTDDGMTLVARAEDAEHLLSTFKSLPERWQRVLWLSEIEGAPRGDIAHALGIRPNAVSALLRRARLGLQSEWLSRRIPTALSEDPSHAARYLVGYVTGAPIDVPRRAVATHLQACDACRDVHRDLEVVGRRMRKTGLSAAGFAALSVALPTSPPLPAAAVGATVLGVLALGTAGGITGLGAILAGSGLIAALLAGASSPGGASEDGAVEAAAPTARILADAPLVELPPAPPAAPRGTDDAGRDEASVDAGRGNGSPDVPTLDVEFDFDTLVTPRERPPAPATVRDVPPDPAPDGTGPTATVERLPAPTVYLMPALTGTATDAAAVYVAVDDAVYAADLAATTGTWTFDPTGISLGAGAHTVQVWATDASGAAGTLVTGSFTVIAPDVVGFEDTVDFELAEASTTGIVFTARGPAGGMLCVESDSGQQAELRLDDSGSVSRRIRFLAGGFYTLSFTVCGPGWGVTTERSLYVDDPSVIFGPFDGDREVEFSDPAQGG